MALCGRDLEVQVRRSASLVVQDYERSLDPPHLTRPLKGDFTFRVPLSAAEGIAKSGGVMVWKDGDNYLLLLVDERDEVQLHAKQGGVLRFIGRGHLPAQTHWLGFRRSGKPCKS
jgi:hypothetical protein